jgi:hypothetical protein
MKKNIFLYLFVFSLLINVFAYMYFTNQQKSDGQRIIKIQGNLKAMRDSIKEVSAKNANDNYFSLEYNTNARDYFDGQDLSAIAIKVRDAIYAKNSAPGGNPLVGYTAMQGTPFVVSKVKVLNHRWVIVDFTDNTIWGEALLSYFVETDGNISLERVDSTLYPNLN